MAWDNSPLVHLIGAYASAIDDRDFEAVAALFAPAGVLRTPQWEARGRDEILARLDSRTANLARVPALVRHHISSILIENASVFSARGRAYFLTITDAGPDHSGRYVDRYICTEARWLFEEREVLLDWSAAHSRLAGASRPT